MSSSEPLEVVLSALESRGVLVKKSGTGYMCRCPAHDDRNPSLSIGIGDDGKVLIKCFAGCSLNEVCNSIGLRTSDLFPTDSNTERPNRARPKSFTGQSFATADDAVGSLKFKLGDPSARWDYHDHRGELVGMVMRFETSKGKEYRQVSLDRDRGRWVLGAMPSPRPLYGLGELRTLDKGSTVYVCEGEKAADAARSLGLNATTSVGGSNAPHFANWHPLAQMPVVVIPDHDKAGEKYASAVTRQLQEVGAESVRIVRLTSLDPALPESGDIADLVDQAEDLGALRTRLETLASETTPEPVKQEAKEPAHRSRVPVIVRLDEVKPEKIDWLWKERIARGKLTVLAGDPGLGKSFVKLDIAARISKGLAWPDTPDETHKPGGVVLLSAEDGIADTIRPRLDAAGADVSRIVAIEAVSERERSGKARARSFDLTSDIETLEHAVREVDNCKLVIIDPITAYLGATDSHKNGEIRGLLAPLSAFAEKHDVAVLMVSHLNKNTGGAAIYRTMGSLAFTAAARAAWIVIKDDNDQRRRLVLPIKNNIAPDTGGLAYSIVPGDNDQPTIEWESDQVQANADEILSHQQATSEGGALEEAKQWLLDVLSDGPLPAADIKQAAKRDGVASRTLIRAKYSLGVAADREGYASDGRWLWALPHRMPTDSIGCQRASGSTLAQPNTTDSAVS